MKTEVEEFGVITGFWLGPLFFGAANKDIPQKGAADSVEFAWKGVDVIEDCYPGMVKGFYHTHPSDTTIGISQRDAKTMAAWIVSLGHPLFCMIGKARSRETSLYYLYPGHVLDGPNYLVCDSIPHIKTSNFLLGWWKK